MYCVCQNIYQYSVHWATHTHPHIMYIMHVYTLYVVIHAHMQYTIVHKHLHTYLLLLPSNQSFYRQFASDGKWVGHHKVGQWWTEVNYQQNSYLTVIGVHSTMHLMHPNYCQITIICRSPFLSSMELATCRCTVEMSGTLGSDWLFWRRWIVTMTCRWFRAHFSS